MPKNNEHISDILMRKACCNVARHGQQFLYLHPIRIFVLSLLAGSFICLGANLSLVFSLGDMPRGVKHLLMGFGFFIAFGMVVLSGAAIFTEVNVAFPFLWLCSPTPKPTRRICATWALVWVGNVLGTILMSCMLSGAELNDSDVIDYLHDVTDQKLNMYNTQHTISGWCKLVLSSMLGNWMVGIAIVLANSTTSNPGKLFIIFLPIQGFVTLGMEHSAANMGYLHLNQVTGNSKYTWGEVWSWNIIPTSVGNLLGGAVMVAGLFYFVYVSRHHPDNYAKFGHEFLAWSEASSTKIDDAAEETQSQDSNVIQQL